MLLLRIFSCILSDSPTPASRTEHPRYMARLVAGGHNQQPSHIFNKKVRVRMSWSYSVISSAETKHSSIVGQHLLRGRSMLVSTVCRVVGRGEAADASAPGRCTSVRSFAISRELSWSSLRRANAEEKRSTNPHFKWNDHSRTFYVRSTPARRSSTPGLFFADRSAYSTKYSNRDIIISYIIC